MAVLVIEHDMRFIFSLCDRVPASSTARNSSRAPREVQADDRVIAAYLGAGDEDDGVGARARPRRGADPTRRRETP